jgi:hypothetical protein
MRISLDRLLWDDGLKDHDLGGDEELDDLFNDMGDLL